MGVFPPPQTYVQTLLVGRLEHVRTLGQNSFALLLIFASFWASLFVRSFYACGKKENGLFGTRPLTHNPPQQPPPPAHLPALPYGLPAFLPKRLSAPASSPPPSGFKLVRQPLQANAVKPPTPPPSPSPHALRAFLPALLAATRPRSRSFCPTLSRLGSFLAQARSVGQKSLRWGRVAARSLPHR